MDEEYNPDIVSVVDEDGKEHVFEELDRIETDDGRYVALLPLYDDAETYLEPIEDDDEFNEIGQIFEERLSEMFDFDDEETE